MTTPGKSPEINPWRFLDRSSGPPFSGRCVSTHSYQRVKRCKESSFHTLDWKKRHVQMIEKQCTSRDWNSYCKISTRIKPYNPFCFPSTVSWKFNQSLGQFPPLKKPSGPAPESAPKMGSDRSSCCQECRWQGLATAEAHAQRKSLGLPRAALLPEAACLVGQSEGLRRLCF